MTRGIKLLGVMLLTVGGAAAGCKAKEQSLSICPEMVAAGKATESVSRDLPTDVWFSLLLRNFNRTAMDVGEEVRECSGQPVAVAWPTAMSADPRVKARKLPRETLTADDLTFAQIGDDDLLVWARVDKLENGDAIGPVGLVHWVARGVEIKGIGTVQAPAQRVRMRLEPVGEDLQVLVLESETCPPDQPNNCVREAQIVPLAEQRFVSAPMIEDGEDRGPARFLLADTREEPLKDGWTRRYDLQRRLEFDGLSVAVQESIKTRDCDPKSPATPCEEHVAANEKRTLTFKDGMLYTSRGAWGQVGKPTLPTSP
jgi:hypothetical protein